MPPGRSAIPDVVESVADGTADVDWDAIELGAADDREKRLIRQLRILARISEVHRSQTDDGAQGTDLAAVAIIGPPLVAPPLGGRSAPIVMPPAPPPGHKTEGPPSLHGASVSGARVGGSSASEGGRVIPFVAAQGDAANGSAGAGASESTPGSAPGFWGSLQLVEKVGEGTFGEVYRAFDTQLHREVAVKLLRVGRSQARLTERVLREGRVLARIHHPNVVVIHGAEQRDGRTGLWMEYIRGATLEQLLKTQGTFSAREAALIGQDLCRAVAAVHGAGLVHRDIKAQNVMREEGGRVVLMDFGAGQPKDAASRGPARLTGTPLYLAPEVLNGGEASVRSDLYSLGVLLYRLVTGDFPVRAGTIEELRTAHAEGRVVRLHDARPDLPDAFVQVVEAALQPDPTQRVASAGQLQSLLGQSTVFHGPSTIPGTGLFTKLVARLRGVAVHPWRWAAVAVVCAALVTAGIMAQRTWLAPTVTVVVVPFDAAGGIPAHLVEDISRRTTELLGESKGMRVRLVQAGAPDAPNADDGADYVLRGRLSSNAQGLQASVRLIRAGSSTAMWDRSVAGNAARLPTELATAVVSRLTPTGTTTSRTSASSEAAAELDARGRYALEHGPDRFLTAVALFRGAIEADKDYARAHAGLARALLSMGCSKYGDEGLHAAQRATVLDPGGSEGFTVLGNAMLYCRWDWDAAESAYRTAVSLNPSDEYARTRLAMYLAGRYGGEAGLAEMLRGRTLDAMSATAAGATAQLLYYSRRFDEAEREIQRALQLDNRFATGYFAYGRILTARGRYVEATRAFAQADALDPSVFHEDFVAEIAAADAAAGRSEEAENFVKKYEQNRGNMSPEMLAFVHARLGNFDRAFHWLDQAVSERSTRLLWLRVDPRADPLRGDPRFDAVLRRLSIPTN
jgi:eukaryotic-like serine/threonine-protein kinase